MREKYESLALLDLKSIAKARGIKGTSIMKKAEVVNAMLELDEKENASKESNLDALHQRQHLILHQRDQRRDHQRYAV